MSDPSAIDYGRLYDGYWQRPDRFGEHSFADPDAIVAEIMTAFGPGRVLDVGCGMGWLVRTLLAHGVDAQGADVSAVAVEHCNTLAPGRFHRASLLELPFPDACFDVVVSTDCLEHLGEQDVPRALAEMRRVASRGVYLRVATTPDRDGHWHLTVQQRAWWEERLFDAGFRKHPRAMAVVPYERLEQDGWQITLVFERLPETARVRHPRQALAAARDLHMDMLRETGRRSDAHVARYHLAASLVRPNDVVLDVACGLGYGSAVLAANSEASRVVGVDLDPDAARYAADVTGAVWPQTTFHAGDATDLANVPSRSIDLIVSFETLEHVPDPDAVLAEFDRVLKPSGRVVVSVPHLWVDDSGRDPNPHHLHVYDWPKLRAQLTRHFLPEALWAQTAGGGMKLAHASRAITRVALGDPGAVPAEWWLAAAMKSPLGADAAGYVDTTFPVTGEPPHITAFARDYANPWLVKAMVVRGQRLLDDGVLADLARGVLATTAAGAGADEGAALCVLGYRLLADRDATAAGIERMLASIDGYCGADAPSPNAFRWQLSLHYLAACLLRHAGRRAEAAARFRQCADLDASRYSAILGTKTVDALLQAGRIAAADRDWDTARADWRRGLGECERLLRGDWSEFVADRDRPLSFGLREATDLLDLGADTARALLDLPAMAQRPGMAWQMGRTGLRTTIGTLQRGLADLERWNVAQARAVDQLRTQLAQAHAAPGATPAVPAGGDRTGPLQRALDDARTTLAERDRTIAEQAATIATLQRMRGLKGTIRGLVARLRTQG